MIIKVAINARVFIDDELRGWGQYSLNLILQLQKFPIEIYLVSNRKIQEKWLNKFDSKKVKVIQNKNTNYFIWEQLLLPFQLLKNKVDLYHCPVNYGIPLLCPVKSILTLHDAIDHVMWNRKKSFKKLLSLSYWSVRSRQWISRKFCNKIIAVSEYSKRDFIKFFGLKEEKIQVIYEGPAENFVKLSSENEKMDVKKKYQLPDLFFLYVGGHEERKNVSFLFKAFSLSKSKEKVFLVTVGANENERNIFKNLAAELGIESRVKMYDFIGESDLPHLYSHAQAFIYPSLYEGFGLQLTESFVKKIPVLAANASCFPEIVNNPENLFELNSEIGLAEKMDLLINNQAWKNKLISHSEKRSLDFSLAKEGQETYQLYLKLIENN